MDQVFLFWALSTLPGLGHALAALGTIGMLVSCIIWVAPLIETPEEETRAIVYTTLKILAPTAFICFLVGWSLPSTNNVVRAFILVEGSKVITTEDVDSVAAEIHTRVDKVMDKLENERK